MIEDVRIINFKKVKDSRGYFSKIFSEKFFNINNIKFKTKEHFISFSKKDVIRGMHYQSGRYAQNKLVYVISGKINDVFIDLRKSSKTYLRTQNIVLSSVNNVEGCTSSLANWTQAYTTSSSQTTLVVSGLAADVSYEFMVSAISSIGLGPTTRPVNATTLSSEVPLAPHYTSISILSSHSFLLSSSAFA
jgi:hypothetical protein